MAVRNTRDPELSLGVGSTNRIHSYCSRLGSPNEKVIFDDKVRDVLLKYAWDPNMMMDLWERTRNLTLKDGHTYAQSIYDPNKLHQQVMKFTLPNHVSFRWNRNYQQALSQVKALLSGARLKPLHYTCDDDVMDALPKRNTHAGQTYLETGKRTKGENLEGIFEKLKPRWEAAKISGTMNRLWMANYRTQGPNLFDDYTGEFLYSWSQNSIDADHKTRLILMADLYQVLTEVVFQKPIQKWFSRCDWYAGGKDLNQISIIITARRMQHRMHHWVSLDYSSFDQSISSWLIEDAFSCLRTMFDDSIDEQLWDVVVHDFIHKEILDFEGVFKSHRGVPSGSMFTQIIDSVVNWISILTYLNSRGLRGEMLVMGDDNLLFTEFPIDVKDMAGYLARNLGLTVNAKKTRQGNNGLPPEFLSRVWTADGQERSEKMLLLKMTYPERFRPYADGVTPQLVVAGYIDQYPNPMKRLMNVSKFIEDNPFRMAELIEVDSRYIPGAWAYIREYTLWSPSKTA